MNNKSFSDFDLNQDKLLFDEDDIEKALKNIVAQMNSDNMPEEVPIQHFEDKRNTAEGQSEYVEDYTVPGEENEADKIITPEDDLQNEAESLSKSNETGDSNENPPEAKNIPDKLDDSISIFSAEAKNIEYDSLPNPQETENSEDSEDKTESFENNSEEIARENPLENLEEGEFDTNNVIDYFDENPSLVQGDVIKKYIVYISKDFIPYIDNLSVDVRSAYINDALQIKIDLQNEKKQKKAKINAAIHTLVAAFVAIVCLPIGFFVAHKAIIATFDNYRYSQENFEKLYRQRFERDRAYMRSVEYNKRVQMQKNIENAK